MVPHKPDRNFNFDLSLGSEDVDGFEECSGLERLKAGFLRRAGAKKKITKITGINKSTDVTLKRGVISSSSLQDWLQSVKQGNRSDRRDVFIRVHDKSGKTEQTWKLVKATITKYTGPALSGKGTDVAIEELVLSYERIELQ